MSDRPNQDKGLVILSEAKDLGSLEEGTEDEILRFAQDDRLLSVDVLLRSLRSG